MDLQAHEQIRKNYSVFLTFASILSVLGFHREVLNMMIQVNNNMNHNGWVYPWRKMKLKQGRWKK